MSDFISMLGDRSASMPWFQLVTSFATVFVGLICIVIICKIVSAFCKGSAKKEAELPAKESAPVPVQSENREELIAAVTAACAEAMGKDVKALRVVSFKKL